MDYSEGTKAFKKEKKGLKEHRSCFCLSRYLHMYVFHASQIEIAWQRDGVKNKPRTMLSTTSTVHERLCCFENSSDRVRRTTVAAGREGGVEVRGEAWRGSWGGFQAIRPAEISSAGRGLDGKVGTASDSL